MSSLLMPHLFRTFSAEGAGPVNMIVGSVPVDEKPTIFALGVNPNSSPISFVPTITALAPSTITLEFPA